jgi:hypothetical protein
VDPNIPGRNRRTAVREAGKNSSLRTPDRSSPAGCESVAPIFKEWVDIGDATNGMRAFVADAVDDGSDSGARQAHSPSVDFRCVAPNSAKKVTPGAKQHKSLDVGTGSSIWTFNSELNFESLGSRVGSTERTMTTLQAIALGAMLAWTPSLIILAVSLWDVPEL